MPDEVLEPKVEKPATPETPPVVEATKETPPDPKPAATEVKPFDKKAAEQVEDFVTSAGLDIKDVAQAVTDNDGVTPEILAALVKEHGEAVASLISEKLEAVNTSFKDSRKSEDDAIYGAMKEAFPDEEDAPEKIWADLAGWAKTEESGITEEERGGINDMLQAGGIQAKFAVKLLLDSFKSSEAFTQTPSLEKGTSVADDHGLKFISKQDYSTQRRELEKKGHREGSEELRKLDARRSRAISRGH